MKSYQLKLYITGYTVKSQVAITNIRRICEDRIKEHFDLKIIDVLEQPEEAEYEKILATPTLVREKPLPPIRIVGDLSDLEKVVVGLDLLN